MLDAIELVQRNMLDYAQQVNEDRALPDAKDGLKPIHRKILYEMYADKILSSGKYHKNASMVGNVIARFSEHGDTGTYDALVRLSQPWVQRYCLIDFHGNYGSIFGDKAGAMRYTESKLSPIAEYGMLKGLKDNLPQSLWGMNYLNEEPEPISLLGLFPGLFCLPNQGIGYGVACNFLTFNLKDVYELIKAYLNNEELPIIYYDLATGGTFVNPAIMDTIYKTGKGSVIIESKYEFAENQIIFSELPFGVESNKIIEKVRELVEKDEIPHLVDFIDGSGDGKVELIATVESEDYLEVVKDMLFSKTSLRESFGINQIALVDGQPTRVNIEDMLSIYVKHNIECILTEYKSQLKSLLARIHILQGLAIALRDIDNIIQLIKLSSNSSDAKDVLKARYKLSDEQCAAILKMTLSKLSRLETQEVEKELREKQEKAIKVKEVIDSEDKQKEILTNRLSDFVEKFGDDRRTLVQEKKIITLRTEKQTKEFVPEEVVICFTKNGYIKSIPLKQYKDTKDKTTFKIKTNETILLFSNLGKAYRILAMDVPQCGVKDKGKSANTLVKLDEDEEILNIFSMNIDEKRPYIVGFTKQGIVKKSEKSNYISTGRNLTGFKVANLNDGDEYISFYECNGDYAAVLTNNLYLIKFDLEQVRPIGKNAKGVKAITLEDNDYVTDAIVISKNTDFATINNLKIKISDYQATARGRKGKKIP